MEQRIKMSKTDRLFVNGLEKLTQELRKDILNGHYKITKKRIMQLAIDDSIGQKSIKEISQIP